MLKAVASTQSETGNVRSENQDAVLAHFPDTEHRLTDHGALYALADGMGGYADGSVASQIALDTFFETYYSTPAGKTENALRRAMQAANFAVFQEATRRSVRMGTTLTAITLLHNQLLITHAGDCRVYLVRGGQATCLTRDHTVVGDLVAVQLLSPDKVRGHAQRSMLNRSLGSQMFIQADITAHTLRQDDRVIICSDGVWSVIEDAEFGAFATHYSQMDDLSQQLIATALERGTDDNVSVIAVHVEQVGKAIALPSAGGWGKVVARFLGSAGYNTEA